MRSVRSCSECPMYRDGDQASLIIGDRIIVTPDVCGMNGREFTAADGEDATVPPPKWCPLRSGDAVVRLEPPSA